MFITIQLVLFSVILAHFCFAGTKQLPGSSDEFPDGSTSAEGHLEDSGNTVGESTQGEDEDEYFQCPAVGQYADPNSCNTFNICVEDGNGGFVYYPRDCPEGTVFCETSDICDWPSHCPCTKDSFITAHISNLQINV